MESAAEMTLKEDGVFDLQLVIIFFYYPFFFNKSGDCSSAFLSGSGSESTSENRARCFTGTDVPCLAGPQVPSLSPA